MTQTLTPVDSWDSVIIPVGGEARTIASLETGFQALTNRTQHLYASAALNGINGGSYSPSAVIVLSRAGDVLDIGDGTDVADLTIRQNARIIVDVNGAVVINGNLTLAGVTQSLTSPLKTTGAGRVIPALDTDATETVDSNLTVQPNANRRVLVQDGDLSGNRTWALGTSGVQHGDTIQVCNKDVTYHVAIGGLNLKFAAGSPYEATFIYDSAVPAWATLSKSDYDF